MTGDLVNSLFVVTAIVVNISSIRKLYLDKEVKGVSVLPQFYYLIWSFWHIYFYQVNKGFLSFLGEIGMAIVIGVWIIQWIYYKRRIKKAEIKRSF